MPILHILSAKVVADHVLHVQFSNGVQKTVDVLPLLVGPVFDPLYNVNYFAQVAVDPVCKTVVWPNGADLAPEALFELDDVSVSSS